MKTTDKKSREGATLNEFIKKANTMNTATIPPNDRVALHKKQQPYSTLLFANRKMPIKNLLIAPYKIHNATPKAN